MEKRSVIQNQTAVVRLRWSLYRRLTLCAAIVGAAGAVVLPQTAGASTSTGKWAKQEHSAAGVVVSAEASAKEVGLPLYPGAKPRKDEGEDSPATQLGLWGTSFGFKLIVLKLESNDSLDKVAAFYQKALARYGTVLNCSKTPPASAGPAQSGSSKQLDCGSDKPDSGGMLFKAGTREQQHIVGIKPNGKGSLFQLIYVEARDGNKEKL
jgi:hypothetical protein